jgi:uncharacterized protein YgfB (UPF0149 family)
LYVKADKYFQSDEEIKEAIYDIKNLSQLQIDGECASISEIEN